MQSCRRRVRDESDAQELLAAYKAWPDSFRAFCADQGVDGRSLRAWMRRLIPEHPPPAFQLLQRPDQRPQATTYTIAIRDWTLQLRDDFDDHALLRILAILQAC